MKRFLIILVAGLLLPASLFAQHTRSGHDWTVHSSSYSFNMTVIAQVQLNGTVDSELEIGAFCGEECRGTATSQYETSLSRYNWYLTIHGDTEGDPISFFVRKQGVELEAVTAYSTTFSINGIIGNPINPQIINFTTSAPQNNYLLVTDPSQLVAGRNYLFSATEVLDVTNAMAITLDSWTINVSADGSATLRNVSNDETLNGYLFVQCEFIYGVHATLNITDATALYVVPSDSILTVNELSTVNAGNLILEDGAQLVNASPNVQATLQKNITAYADVDDAEGYYTLAAPLNSTEVASSSNMTVFDYDLYEFDETDLVHEEWRNYKAAGNFDSFTPGRGYLYANSHDLTLNFFGTMNNSNENITLTYTDARNDELVGCNLIGNPYPHVIYKGQGGAIDDTRLADGYYLLSYDGAWQAKTCTDPIQPGVGILVMAFEAGDFTIVKTNNQATTESKNRRDLGNDRGRLSLSVSNGASKDVAYLYGEKDGRGLKKISHMNSRVPELSFYCNRERYAIASYDDDEAFMDIRFDNRVAATYTLTWDVADWHGEHPYLIDNITGAEIDLLSMSDYTFEATVHEHPYRFKMVFGDAIEESGSALPVLQGEGPIQVFDMTGRVVMRKDSVSTLSTEGLAPGVYLVRWIDGNTQKIVVR